MEIKEGYYVRTKKGIAKIIGRINDPTNFYYKMLITDKFLGIHDDTEYIHDLDIIKVNKNINELLEVGDYVNGQLVIQVCSKTGYVFTEPTYYDEIKGEEFHFCYKTGEIKDVVTKEQFNSVKYDVEG